MLNALSRTVRTSSPRRYAFQARSISRIQRKQTRSKNIDKIPERARSKTFWDSKRKKFSQAMIEPRVFDYTSGLFNKYFHQEVHSVNEIEELWELVSKYDYIRFDDALDIIHVFEESSRQDLAKSILYKIDFKQISPSDLIELGKKCATFNALDLIVEISNTFGISEYNRPVILRVLEECTKLLIRNKKSHEALDVYMRCCIAIFENHGIEGSFYGQNFLNSYGTITKGIIHLEDVVEVIQRHSTHDNPNLNKSLYYTVTKSLFYAERNTTRLKLLFEMIPEESKHHRLVSYTFRSFLYHGRPLAASEIRQKYPEMLNDEDKSKMQKYLRVMEIPPENVYTLFTNCLETDVDLALPLLRGTIKRFHNDNMGLVDQMVERFISRFPESGVSAYNSIMRLYLSENKAEEFFKTFRILVASTCEPNDESYGLLLDQFCKKQDLKSAFSLVDFMIEKKIELTKEHMGHLLTTCSIKGNVSGAKKIEKIVELLDIDRDAKFHAKMMSIYNTFDQSGAVMRIFNGASGIADSNMYAQLIRLHLRKKDFSKAQNIFNLVSKGDFDMGEDFYFLMIDYFCHIKDYDSAEIALTNIIKSPESYDIHKGFEKLMSGYNKHMRYMDATQVFNKLLELEMNPSDNMLRLLLKSLSRTNFVNFGNYSRPKKIAADIMKAYSNKTLLPERDYLSIKIFRPLLKYLTDYYDPLEALKLLEHYDMATRDDDKRHDVAYMKERIIISAKLRDWNTVNVVFSMLIEELKVRLGDDKSPYAWRNLLTPVIGPAAKTHEHLNQQEEFEALVDDFIRMKHFILNNQNLNDVATVLLGNQKTFESGLKILEKKLMGGFIARAVMRGREWFESALPYGVPLPTYKNHIKAPNLYLMDSSYMQVVMHLRLYLRLKAKESKSYDHHIKVLLDLKTRYPKVYRNFYGTCIHVFPHLREEILDSINQ